MTTDHPPQVEELLPCPICGDYPRRNGLGRAGGVVCASTGLLSKRPSHRIQTYAATQADADAAWNTRLASTPQPSGEGWRDIEALVAACEREFTSELTEMEGDPEDGPWRDDDDEAVSHGMADDGHTLVPGEITFGHIRRARAALTNLTAPRSSQPSDMIGEAVAAERERCARIAESEPRVWRSNAPDPQTRIAAAIRLPTATEGEMS